jgi:hypothetical protein
MKTNIPIFSNNKINPIFLIANRLILSKFNDQINQKNTPYEKIVILEHLWYREHKAILKKDIKSCWESINFENLEDLIIFKLKFG